jgi:HlyD family secretion protein
MSEAPPLDTVTSPAEARLPMLLPKREPVPVPGLAGAAWRVFKVARFVPVIMALMLTGATIGLYFQPPGVRKVMELLNLQPGGGATNPIAVPAPRAPPSAPPVQAVVGLGRLLPEGDVITIAPPFGAGDARILRLAVAEGEQVAAGQILAILDSERQFLAALESSRANAASREASLAQVQAAIAASRAEAQAQLARAEITAENAAREFERIEQLRRSGYAADQAFDQRRAQRDETQRDLERARATLSRYGGELERQADVVVARRALEAARADLERASADLDKAYARAPAAATVLTIQARPGEKPGAKGIMTIGAIDRMQVEMEVYQAQIGLVVVGAPVEITAEALGQPLHGAVRRIGLEVGRQTLIDAGPAAVTDARVIKVTVALDAASSAQARRFSNLQVIARIAVPPPS